MLPIVELYKIAPFQPHFITFCENNLVVSINASIFAPTEPATLPGDQRTRAGRFLYMEYTKQAITLADQINILKQRGLIFEDENAALRILSQISYFRLASYWRVMEENSRMHRFRSGSKFSTVLSLYTFDSELRSLVFKNPSNWQFSSQSPFLT